MGDAPWGWNMSTAASRDPPRRIAKVILCGGAVNSPQLLQLSGIGPASTLSSAGVTLLLDNPPSRKSSGSPRRRVFLQGHPADLEQ